MDTQLAARDQVEDMKKQKQPQKKTGRAGSGSGRAKAEARAAAEFGGPVERSVRLLSRRRVDRCRLACHSA